MTIAPRARLVHVRSPPPSPFAPPRHWPGARPGTRRVATAFACATVLAIVVLVRHIAVGIRGASPTARADSSESIAAAPSDPFSGGTLSAGIDAIFVERDGPWWLVDDGVSRSNAPSFELATDEIRALGSAGAAEALAVIEAGEGGGYADGSGRGPPPPPSVALAAGVGLVAAVRDTAIVLRSDGSGRLRAGRAIRYAESDDRAGSWAAPSPTAARARETRSESARVARDPTDAVTRARRAALHGDAIETLRLVHLAEGRPRATRAQALARLGRFHDAADEIGGLASRAEDSHDAAALRSIEGSLRARAGDAAEALRAREDAADAGPRRPATSLDLALSALPTLVEGGRTKDAVNAVALAVAGRDGRVVARSVVRRRAVLAAAALALDVGELAAAGALLRRGATKPVDARLAPIVEAIDARRRAAEDALSVPRRGVGKPPRGG